jgi:hypothetical protein
MTNGWTEKVDQLCRELADAKSANAAMRDNVDQKGRLLDTTIAQNSALCDENMRLRIELGRLRGAYETALRIANETRKMGTVKMV